MRSGYHERKDNLAALNVLGRNVHFAWAGWVFRPRTIDRLYGWAKAPVTITFGTLIAILLFVVPGYLFLVVGGLSKQESDMRLLLNSIVFSAFLQLIISNAIAQMSPKGGGFGEAVYGIEILSGSTTGRGVQSPAIAASITAGLMYILASMTWPLYFGFMARMLKPYVVEAHKWLTDKTKKLLDRASDLVYTRFVRSRVRLDVADASSALPEESLKSERPFKEQTSEHQEETVVDSQRAANGEAAAGNDSGNTDHSSREPRK